MATIEELEGLLNQAPAQQQAGQVDVNFLESLLPQEPSTLQSVTPQQQARLEQLRQSREETFRRQRERFLPGGIEPQRSAPGREELLLQQGLETEGPALRTSRLRASFTSNPIPTITQGLLEEFPDASAEQLNVRFEPLVPTKELQQQIDNATNEANAASEREIRERMADGEEISQETRSKIFGRNLQTFLTKMPGLELVYDNPATGRTTVANPVGADIGDLAEFAGPSLPFTGELVGGTAGGIIGAPGGVPGVVGGSAVGGGLGSGTGEAARLGIGRMIGAEPEEADFIDPVLSRSGTGAFNSALGGGINALISKSIAKQVAAGKFGIEAARFGNFLDPATFARNKAAVDKFNQLAAERGLPPVKPTFGQLSGSEEALNFERSLASVDSPLTAMKAENARLIDDVASSFNPKSGALKRGEVPKLINRIAGEIEKRIVQQEKTLGRKITESEAREVAAQTKNIISSEMRTDNALAADSLRQAADDAERTVFGEKFGAQFRGIEERAAGVNVQPQDVRQTAQNIQREQADEVFQLSNAEEQKFLQAAADSPDVVSFEGLSRGLSNLKELKRKIDSGQLPDKNSRTAARLIQAGENDLQQALVNAGREDILQDLLTTRQAFGEAKRLSKKAFGRLLSRDRTGNFKVDDADVFQRIVLNPGTAPAIKSMLIDSGQEAQIPLIREGIRDIYARRFLPEGAAPGQLDKAAAQNWFNQNERALKQFFSDKELAAFKNPAVVAKQESANRKKLQIAQKKMRQWFGADLASTKDTPQEFMDTVFNKGTPTRMKQLKALLPGDQWENFKDLYRTELLSKVRAGAAEPGFNVSKLFAQTGQAQNASAREVIGRQTAEQVLGKKELADLQTYGDAIQVLNKIGNTPVKAEALPRGLRAIKQFFVPPLSIASRRANVLLNEGKTIIERRMERALADPEKLDKMIKAVNEFQKDKFSQATVIGFIDALGSDTLDQLAEIEQEIKEGQ